MEILSFNFPIFIIQDIYLSMETKNHIENTVLEKKDRLNTSYSNKYDEKLLNLFNNDLKNSFQKVCNKLNMNKYTIKNIWIQKYLQNEYHPLHIHNTQQLSFVYYVNVSDNSAHTEFYNPGYPYFLDRIVNVKPITNSLVIFHGAIPHQTALNNDEIRTIVSGNILLHD